MSIAPDPLFEDKPSREAQTVDLLRTGAVAAGVTVGIMVGLKAVKKLGSTSVDVKVNIPKDKD